MACRIGHDLRLSSFRLWGWDHLRSVKDGGEDHWGRFRRAGLSLAGALLLLIIVRLLGQGLLVGVAGAALVLVLQEAVDPTPLFWTAPWEAIQLLLSRKRRVNHHRTQELARESIGRSSRVDGFAMTDGFVLIGVGGNNQLVRWTAECAWRGIQKCDRAGHPRGCKAVRFLLSVWLLTGGLCVLTLWRGIDLPAALLIAVFSGAAGHALARPFENKLGTLLARPARNDVDSGVYRLEVETVEFPEWLWWQGSEEFIVRRIRDEEPRKD